MNMKKRIISLFMCFVMAFSLLPTAAWAELLPVTEDGQQEVVADPSGDEVQPGDAEENVGGEDADVGGAGEGDEDGQPEDGAPVEDGENGEDGGDNGDADAPAGEDAAPAAPQNDESGESNGVVNSVTEENAVAQIGEVYYATLPAALAAAQDGDTVKMLADHVTNDDDSTLAIVTKTLTLDLAGCTVDQLQVGDEKLLGTGEDGSISTEVTPGNLTVKTTSDGTMGRIEDLDFVKGTLDIQGGEIGYYEGGLSGGPAGGLTCHGNSGSVTISGGIVLGLTVGDGASVTVSGGSNHAGNWFNDGTLVITGGQFSEVYFQDNKDEIAISGGTFGTITNTDASTTIPAMYLLAEGGYAFYDTEDKVVDGSTGDKLRNVVVKEHTHTIENGKCACGMTFVASVTAKDSTVSGYYDTLEKAFAAAKDWNTVTLLTDVALAAPLSIEADESNGYRDYLTLDLNGKKISCSANDTTTVFTSATLTICDSSDEKTGEIKQDNNGYAVQSGQGGKLTITGGTFGKVGIFGDGVISGGTFSEIWTFDSRSNPVKLNTVLADGYAFADKDDPTSIVNGYEKTNAENVTVVAHTHSGASCACGYICDHSAGMNSASGDCTSCGESIAQASVGAGESITYCRKFTDAIAEAANNTDLTVTLLRDVTLTDGENIYIGDMYKNYSLTIDWNGHILSGNTPYNLLVIAQRSNVTLKDSSGSNAGGVRNTYGLFGPAGGIAVCVSVLNGYCVTIEGGTYSAQVKKARDCVGTIRISGGVFQNPTGAAVNYALYDEEGGNLAGILAEDCTFSYDANGTDLVNVYGDDHTDAGKTVYVVAHSHAYNKDTGKCACGKPCAHELDENGVCSKCQGTYVAQVGSDYYTTVTAALSAAGNNGTVTLLTDVTQNVVFNEEGKSVTVRMNGKKLTAPDNSASALTVTSGTLTVSGNATISNPYGGVPGTTQPAILVTGGKLAFEDKLTAEGGYRGNADNYFHRAYAVKATGGELDFQGELDLKGGLAVLETATLTNKLTQGAFWVDRDEKELPEEAILKVGGTTNHKYLENLLADGYAYVDKKDTSIFRCVHSFTSWTGDVTIVPHTHTWGPTSSSLYECTVCGKSCAHEGGYKTGACTVCGKPCPHDVADQNSTDHNYYCNDCGQQMFARIQTDTYQWSHFTNLPDALAAAEDGQTVVLLADINNDNRRAILIGDNKTVTLDLNGKTVTGGWIQIGYENWNDQTSSTLKVVGSGSIMTSGNLSVGYKATLDLSGWTGGKISHVEVSNDKDTKVDGKLIVGETEGTIENLAFYNRRTASISSELSGGTYGSIEFTISDDKVSVSYSDMLAEGYAFQYVDGSGYVAYGKKALYSDYDSRSIENVKVVKCEHTPETVAGTDGRCACGQVQFEAKITRGTSTTYAMLSEAVSTLQDGDTLTLLAHVRVATGVVINKSVTIDLNDKTLSSAEYLGLNGILQIEGGTVTVKNGTVKANESGTCAIRADGGDTTLENVTVVIVGSALGGVAVCAPVTIKSGDYQGLYVYEGCRAVLEGGTFHPYRNTSTGEYINSIFWKVNANSEVTSRDCMELLADGYGYADKNDQPVRTFGSIQTVVTVKEDAVVNDPVAKIGGTEYTGLHSAMKAAKDGDTITLLKDLDLGDGAVLLLDDITTSFTIDLGGHTLSASGTFLVHTYDRNSSCVTLKNGTLDGSKCAATASGGAILIANRYDKYGLTLENVTAKSGTVTDWTDKVVPVPVVKVSGGTAVFNGGSYTGGVLISNGNMVLNSGTFYKGQNEYGIKTEVSGKSLADYLGEDSVFWESEEKQKIVDLSSFTEAESAVVDICDHEWVNGKCTVCEKVCGHQEPVNGKCPICGQSMVASVDGTFYHDFASALEVVKTAKSCTLKLYTDFAYGNTEMNSNTLGYTKLTVDLNGYDLYGADGTSKVIQVIDGAELVIQDTSVGKNGSVDNVQVFTSTTGGKLTLESGAVDTLQADPSSTVTLKAGAKVRYLTTGSNQGRFPVAALLPTLCGLVDEDSNWADLSQSSVGSATGTGYYTVTTKWSVSLSNIGGTVETPYASNTISFAITAMRAPSWSWDAAAVRFQWYRTDGLYEVLTDYTATETVGSYEDFAYDAATKGSGTGWADMTVGTSVPVICVVSGLDEDGTVLWCVPSTKYQLTITKADAVVTEMPTAKDLTYTGGAQALVTAGSTTGGTLKYGLAKDGTYSEDIPTATDAGTYTVWYMVEGDSNYNGVEPKSVTVTIGKADAALTTEPAANSLTYNGSAQVLVTAGSTQDGTMLYRLGENGEFGSDIPTATDAGTYTVYYKVVGDSNHNDTDGKANITVTIGRLSIGSADVTLGEGLTYNGKTQTQTVASVEVGDLIVPAGSYTVSDNTGAAAKDYTLTVTGTGNFAGTKSVGFTIAKAELTVPEMTVDVTNGYAATYTVDLRAALNAVLPKGCRFGAVSYGMAVVSDAQSYCKGTPKVNNGVLTLAVNNVNSSTEGNVATVTVAVETDNYKDITLTVQLNAVNKAVPVGAPTLSTRTITYGEKLNTIKLFGTMRVNGAAVKGTFAWAEPYFCPTSDTYTATWVFTPEDGKYAVVTGTETITVKEPAEPVYTVGGTVQDYSVTDENAKKSPIEGAVVTIRKGLEIIGRQQVTDANGKFTLDGVVAGVYNVVVEYQGKTVTTKVELTDHSIPDLTVEIPREDVNSELEIKTPTDLISDVVVGGLDKEAGEQFKDSGKGSVSVGMDITEPPHSTENDAQNAIRGSEELTGKTLDFIDMVLTMVKNGDRSEMKTTRTVLEIIISYDTSRKDIKVVRHHVEGNDEEVSGLTQLDTLPGEGAGVDGTFYIDYEKKCIHIFASKFSTYAIGYTPESNQRYYYNSGTADAKPGESPATGDVGLLPYAAMALTGCTGVVVLTFRRKREHE